MQTKHTNKNAARDAVQSGLSQAITDYKTAANKTTKSQLREAREIANTLNHIIHHQNLYIVGAEYNMRVINACPTAIGTVVVEALNSGTFVTITKDTQLMNGNGNPVKL